jgi:tetratricopeptide (TPR) repeat protein
VRAELKGLSQRMADLVGGHLLMAGKLVDEDPELAYEHALAAKEIAPRLQITREALGETAYAAERYDVALGEFRAVRRMSGTDEYLAPLADCERALGKPQAALRLIKEGLDVAEEPFEIVELKLVEAGIRADGGQLAEAGRLLAETLKESGARGTRQTRARLRYAYADILERVGDKKAAIQWFQAAAKLDAGELDARERLAALDPKPEPAVDELADAGPESEAETDAEGV